MNASIGISAYLIDWLVKDTELCELVDSSQIYPVEAIQTAQLPFIVINRTGIEPEYGKDGTSKDKINVSISCRTNKYIEGINIASAIRKAIDTKRYKDENTTIPIIRLVGVYEGIYQNTFIQQLDFEIQVVN